MFTRAGARRLHNEEIALITQYRKRWWLLGAAVAVQGALVAAAAEPQPYPSRPVRLVVGSTGGGGSDLYARLIGRKLGEMWGQQVIVDNRPGAGMALGAQLVAKAPPDGYTLFMAHPNSMTVGPALRTRNSYDPVRDFAPITLLMAAPSMLSVQAASPWKSLGEIIGAARKKPGEISYGTSGSGSVGNLIGELLSQTVDARLLHVPYKSAALALLDVAAGRIVFVSSSLTSQLPFVRDGKLRPLATTGARRARLTPNVPTVMESGVPGFDVMAWHGVVAPARTPPEIVAKLNRDIVRTLAMPDVQEVLLVEGGEITPTTPEQFAGIIRTELSKWTAVVRRAGITTD